MSEYSSIPQVTVGSLERYVNHGIAPGGFLCAVLENDLFGAVGKADLGNQAALPAIVKFVYNRCPQSCWGSKDAIKRWVGHNGLSGLGHVTEG